MNELCRQNDSALTTFSSQHQNHQLTNRSSENFSDNADWTRTKKQQQNTHTLKKIIYSYVIVRHCRFSGQPQTDAIAN